MITLQALRKVFGNTVAVDDIDMAIEPGEFMCVIGPSGSGKTTTLRMVAGLERPTSGKVFIGGQDVTKLPPHRRNVPMVWQLFVLFPHLNVRQNIDYGLKKRGVDRQERQRRVDEIARTLNIGRLLDRWTTELSGGEQQRVGLARALVLQSPVLLLDEPLGSLDANLALTVQGQLKDVHRRFGLTYLYVTHNQSEALAMGDRIAVMNGGTMEQIGTPRELTNDPKTRFVAEFVGRNNVFDGLLERKNGLHAQVTCPLGALWGQMRSADRLVETVAYAVSADRIRLAASFDADAGHTTPVTQGPENTNMVSGVVRGGEYHGAWTLIAVDVNGVMLRANIPSEMRPELGERIALTWKRDDALVLPA